MSTLSLKDKIGVGFAVNAPAYVPEAGELLAKLKKAMGDEYLEAVIGNSYKAGSQIANDASIPNKSSGMGL